MQGRMTPTMDGNRRNPSTTKTCGRRSFRDRNTRSRSSSSRSRLLKVPATRVATEEMKKRYEPGNLATAMETFRAFIERTALQHSGRLWMWSRFGGLVLFPLRGEGCPAALCGMRILLSRIFYDVEESLLPGRISFRMALSHGVTVYHESETGRLVSDAINSIYHLGRRFTPAGQFLLTAEACAAAPQALRGYCQPAGAFEGKKIMRMATPAAGRQGDE